MLTQGAHREHRESTVTQMHVAECVCVCALFNKVKRRGLVEQSKHVSGEEGREAH